MSSMIATRTRAFAWAGLLVLAALIAGMARLVPIRMGRQPDGSFLVSSGQRIEGGSIAFTGRPIDLALHPRDGVFAVLNKSEVLPGDTPAAGRRRASLFSSTARPRPGSAGWSGRPTARGSSPAPSRGHVQAFAYDGTGCSRSPGRSCLQPEDARGNPVPGGMAITRDGSRLFVAAANRNAVVEVDLTTHELRPRVPGRRTCPFEPRLSEDERTLIVSNWGGRPAQARRPDGQEPGPRHRGRRARRAGLGHGQPDRSRDRRDPARRGRHPSDGDRRRTAAGPTSPTP